MNFQEIKIGIDRAENQNANSLTFLRHPTHIEGDLSHRMPPPSNNFRAM